MVLSLALFLKEREIQTMNRTIFELRPYQHFLNFFEWSGLFIIREKLPKSDTVHLHYQLHSCLQQHVLNANVKGILL